MHPQDDIHTKLSSLIKTNVKITDGYLPMEEHKKVDPQQLVNIARTIPVLKNNVDYNIARFIVMFDMFDIKAITNNGLCFGNTAIILTDGHDSAGDIIDFIQTYPEDFSNSSQDWIVLFNPTKGYHYILNILGV